MEKKSCALSHICSDLSFGTVVRQFEIYPKSSSGPTVVWEYMLSFQTKVVSSQVPGDQLGHHKLVRASVRMLLTIQIVILMVVTAAVPMSTHNIAQNVYVMNFAMDLWN